MCVFLYIYYIYIYVCAYTIWHTTTISYYCLTLPWHISHLHANASTQCTLRNAHALTSARLNLHAALQRSLDAPALSS